MKIIVNTIAKAFPIAIIKMDVKKNNANITKLNNPVLFRLNHRIGIISNNVHG